MELYIDGRLAPDDAAPGATVDDLMEGIRRETARSDRAILGLVCDGIDVFGPELTQTLANPVSQYTRIEVQTGDRYPMLADALDEARASLESVESRYDEVIALLGEGNTRQALELLAQCIGDWHQINEVIGQSLVLLHPGDESLLEGATEFAETIGPVRDKLVEIKNAVAAKDFVTLSDILEYEFADVGDCWRRVIDRIRHRIQSAMEASA